MVRLFGKTGHVGGGWLPTNLGGCTIWLRSDLAWQDAAKTVPCTNESLIWTGEDKSGLGHDVFQATESKRSVYLTNQLNGYPCWRFDGIDDVLISAPFTWNNPATVYIIVKQRAWGARFIYDGINADGCMGIYEWVGPPIIALHTPPLPLPDTPDIGTYYILRAIYNGANSSGKINANVPTTGLSCSTAAGGFTLARLAVTESLYGIIDVVEVIGIDGVVNDEDDTQAMNYLNGRYAIY